MNITELTSWHEPTNPTMLDIINTATINVPKHESSPGRVGSIPTLAWRQLAQASLLAWIESENPDSEEFRSSLHTIEQFGHKLGCSLVELRDAIQYRPDLVSSRIAYQQLTKSLEQYSADGRGPRHFGDAQVVLPREFIASIPISPKERIFRLAWSNGCPKPNKYLGDIRSGMVAIPSISYHPQVIPELNPTFEVLTHDFQLQTIIWDYARYNKLWQTIVSAISSGPNHALYRDIMHGRELLNDPMAESNHVPWPLGNEIQLRFLARTEPYDLMASIWQKFDNACDQSSAVAELVFDQETTRLLTLAERAPNLRELSTAFTKVS